MTWLDRLVCQLVDQAAIQAVPVVEGRLKVAAVSDPPVLTPEDLVRIDEESRMLSEAFRDRTRSMESDASDPRAADPRAHLERVLAIVTEIGGYLSQEHQDVIRRAREAVR